MNSDLLLRIAGKYKEAQSLPVGIPVPPEELPPSPPVPRAPDPARDSYRPGAVPPPSRDSRSAPIIIKKAEQSLPELRGREVVHYMWDEFERLQNVRS
jgi:hypothetical protein